MIPIYEGRAQDDFNRARSKAFFESLFGRILPEDEMLNFDEMRHILPSRGESYRGLKAVNINNIVGSEGRYMDFTKKFLPRKEHLRARWMSIDKAHLGNVVLPPIQLYEIGGVYFVRDGNHRVSVARMQGQKMIDAEVTTLDSDIKIAPSMSRAEILAEVIKYEEDKFMRETGFARALPDVKLKFTAPGRYPELFKHLQEHKYYMNMHVKEEIPMSQAIKSWYREIYLPIVDHVRSGNLLSAFPQRTESDLYMWIVKHWHYLKEKYGKDFSAGAAAKDFKIRFGVGPVEKVKAFFRRLVGRFKPAELRDRTSEEDRQEKL